MAQDNQPDLQVEGWLKTGSVESLRQWDVLVFLYRHKSSLVSAEHIARFQGYATAEVVAALDSLDLGLAAALERYAADYTQAHGIAVDVAAPDLALARLPAEVETALYRIAQEALTNVLKHAAAKAVSLVVRRESSGVHLTVEDDGRGFDNDALLQAPGTGKGLGLLDIRKRAALLNGSVTLESRPGSGTKVHVCIPLREENHG